MVSTHSQSQYITDFTPKAMEPGKSPLALLAKTCETIGLPETPSKKTSSTEKKDSNVSKKTSPRSTPASKEAPSMTFPGLPKPGAFPQMPPMPFPFFNPMMPYPMPFPAFPMARMPCPFAMMRQPCLTPGCIQCTPTSSASGAAAAAAAADMMHPLFNAYSYQSLLASAAAASQHQQQQSTPKASTSTAKTHKCNWMESSGVCGKKFADEEELANHVKSIHTPSPPASTENKPASPGGPMKTPTSRPASSASTSARFNPYAKPVTTPMMAMPPQLNPLMLPFPLQAMYTQRLMSSMPQ